MWVFGAFPKYLLAKALRNQQNSLAAIRLVPLKWIDVIGERIRHVRKNVVYFFVNYSGCLYIQLQLVV